MPQVSLTPITLHSVMHMMQQFGYVLAEDDGRAFYWEKKGNPAKGLEGPWANWPPVFSKHRPLFIAEGHDMLVYDRSDVTDMIVEITGTGRTDGARLVAILHSEANDPELPPAHVIDWKCAACGERSQVDRWKESLTALYLKCPRCGHEEMRNADTPDRQI